MAWKILTSAGIVVLRMILVTGLPSIVKVGEKYLFFLSPVLPKLQVVCLMLLTRHLCMESRRQPSDMRWRESTTTRCCSTAPSSLLRLKRYHREIHFTHTKEVYNQKKLAKIKWHFFPSVPPPKIWRSCYIWPWVRNHLQHCPVHLWCHGDSSYWDSLGYCDEERQVFHQLDAQSKDFGKSKSRK